ncbi:HopJ type III effector protein [Thiomicrorhabdus sp.]|uniref:HopJ type III effector protein n=1 Tax=Thiomicrorhabdus sp. TaxID=2039724 RepID=UPI0035646C96
MSHLSTQALIESLNKGAVAFETVMQTIDAEYEFTPTRFTNGGVVSEANTNNGSCKIFAFAKLNGLSEQATLNAFGDYYTVDVLQHPEGQDHQNIRNFMQTGWNGIEFDGVALVKNV